MKRQFVNNNGQNYAKNFVFFNCNFKDFLTESCCAGLEPRCRRSEAKRRNER